MKQFNENFKVRILSTITA